MKGDQFKDETIFWEMMRRKRKLRTPDSPLVPQQLLRMTADDRNHKSTRVRPLMSSVKPSLRSNVALISPQTPKMDLWIPLGSSPSAATQQVIPFKRTTP